MKIGILTFYRVGNFGANLQALSTYCYLKKQGHEVIFLEYVSKQTKIVNTISEYKNKNNPKSYRIQLREHLRFLDATIKEQVLDLRNAQRIMEAIERMGIEAVIIGSDAVAQHWPLFSTLKLGRHRPFWIEPLQQERRYPNPFWGCGISDKVPTAMMSVSSQNSKYHNFSSYTKKRMAKSLRRTKYISVRDSWTQQMMKMLVPERQIPITPDPVFALNQNAEELIPTEKDIRIRFKLPEKYVLIGLRTQCLSYDFLTNLNVELQKLGKECVAFPITGKMSYSHPFKFVVPLPLSPLDWFALIKYSSGYVGSNMHPIVSCLTSGVPCYSLDNWGYTDFWGRKKNNQSSKVYDVLKIYGIENNHTQIENGECKVKVEDIVNKLCSFPTTDVLAISKMRLEEYNKMMQDVLTSFA